MTNRGIPCRGTIAALVALAAILLPMSVLAQDGPTPKYFLLPTQAVKDGVSSIVPERIGELTRSQVEQDTRVELLPGYDALREQMGGSTAAVEQAEALYTSGIGLLTAGEDQKAAEAFTRAVEMMEANLADLTNYEILADALANLALAHHNAKFDLDARKRMQQFAHLRPEATLDAEKFPKALRTIFDEEVAKVKKAGNGIIEIKASEDAVVLIDGVERGKAPLTVRDVGFGYHYLVVRGTSGRAHSEVLRVRAKGKKQSVDADLDAAGLKSGSGASGGAPAFYSELLDTVKTGKFTDEDVAAYFKELCAQTGAEYIGFVLMLKKRSKYVAVAFAYRESDGGLTMSEDVEFNIELSNLRAGVTQLSESLITLALDMPDDRWVTDVLLEGATAPTAVATTTTNVETPVTVIEPPEPKEKKNWGKTWKWIGIGVGGAAAVGLIAGGIVLLANGDGGGATGFTTEVQW